MRNAASITRRSKTAQRSEFERLRRARFYVFSPQSFTIYLKYTFKDKTNVRYVDRARPTSLHQSSLAHPLRRPARSPANSHRSRSIASAKAVRIHQTLTNLRATVRLLSLTVRARALFLNHLVQFCWTCLFRSHSSLDTLSPN